MLTVICKNMLCVFVFVSCDPSMQ